MSSSISMISSTSKEENSKSSFSVFCDIDNSVAKPVIGSDGAHSWQNWKSQQREDGIKSSSSLSAAPNLPMKQIDRKNTGFQNFDQERENETLVRKKTGDVGVGEGYTVFKRKHGDVGKDTNKGKDSTTKNNPNQQKRIRPQDVTYFIPAKSFEGWKHDYVFTTKEGRGTGYFWDGWDTACGIGAQSKDVDQEGTTSTSTTNISKSTKKKKKKKKTIDSNTQHCVSDLFEPDESNHPMAQVADAIARAALSASSTSSGKENTSVSIHKQQNVDIALDEEGWSSAFDPVSQKIYYFNKKSKETRWDHPLGGVLPTDWSCVKDDSSGKVYYYHHESRRTSWDRPKCQNGS